MTDREKTVKILSALSIAAACMWCCFAAVILWPRDSSGKAINPFNVCLSLLVLLGLASPYLTRLLEKIPLPRKNRRWRKLYVRHAGQLKELSPEAFERYCATLFKKMGYQVEMTPYQKDGGYDLVLRDARRTIMVECKRYADNSVGVEIVRQLYGVFGSKQADEAWIATTSWFTEPAKRFADKKPIRLIDGIELGKLHQQYIGFDDQQPISGQGVFG